MDLQDFVVQVRTFETNGRWPLCIKRSPTPGEPDSDPNP